MATRAAKKLFELLEKSVIVQAILTLGLIGTICYMAVKQLEVPSYMIQWTAFLLGLYGAGKVHMLTKGRDT